MITFLTHISLVELKGFYHWYEPCWFKVHTQSGHSLVVICDVLVIARTIILLVPFSNSTQTLLLNAVSWKHSGIWSHGIHSSDRPLHCLCTAYLLQSYLGAKAIYCWAFQLRSLRIRCWLDCSYLGGHNLYTILIACFLPNNHWDT